ncbi:hypothetical protein SCUCBS95973_004990 [Sporothrix curviconia]|uniref:Serine-threonine protein kinase 19 n=1 Tax=Sporothrix curviconia TaxID=1260050 RepID=A0ABP0BT72_9PEZI
MSLRAILSGSRVKKRTAPAPANKNNKNNAKTNTAKRKTAASSASALQWPSPLRQTKPGSGCGHTGKDAGEEDDDDDQNEDEELVGDDEDVFSDGDEFQLDDNGLVASLADDLSLRDVVQALRYARGNMFDPLPQPRDSSLEQQQQQQSLSLQLDSYGGHGGHGGGGEQQLTAGGSMRRTGFVGNSTRVAELLNMRRRMPPLATTAHVAALLPNATVTERETVSLIRAGMLLKVIQPQWRRGFSGKGSGDRRRGGGGGGGGGGDSLEAKRGGRALMIGGESLGEVLVETAALQTLVREGLSAAALGADTKAAFAGWLGEAGTGGSVASAAAAPSQKRFTINDRPAPQLTVKMVDELVRAGFLVGHGASTGLLGSLTVTGHRSAAMGGGSGGGGGGGCGGRRGDGERGSQSDTGDVYARPEDRTTLLSLETVARAASGSFDAVGGVGAVYTAGGGGARGRYRAVGSGAGGGNGPVAVPTEDLMLAIPGHGTFVKLVSGALAYLVGIVARTAHRETLETSLRERWDAGGSIAKRRGPGGGGAFKRVPLSRTKKWKEFYGMSFDWVLAEAVGAGLVELFDTGSVGRGVRLLS